MKSKIAYEVSNESGHVEVYQLCARWLNQSARLASVASKGLIATRTDQKHNGKDAEFRTQDTGS